MNAELFLVIQNASGRRLPRGLRPLVTTALALVRGTPWVVDLPDEIVVRFVGDPEITALNARFKKRRRATDVLSFDTGDIVVSVDTASRQAASEGHGLCRELAHLAVHGVLHLGGWTDDAADDRRWMDIMTEVILDRARAEPAP